MIASGLRKAHTYAHIHAVHAIVHHAVDIYMQWFGQKDAPRTYSATYR